MIVQAVEDAHSFVQFYANDCDLRALCDDIMAGE
jgi:hypothetical protein